MFKALAVKEGGKYRRGSVGMDIRAGCGLPQTEYLILCRAG